MGMRRVRAESAGGTGCGENDRIVIEPRFDMFTATHPFARRTLILGTTPLARELVQAINNKPHGRYALIGIAYESGSNQTQSFPCAMLGALDDLERIVVQQQPERIIVALGEQQRRYLPIHRLIEARVFLGVVVENGEEVYERLTGKLVVDLLTPNSVMFSKDFQPSGFALALARGTSLLAATIGLFVLAPILGLIAAAIKYDSSGPVFFTQDRIGLGGRRFRMIKFRTMHPAEENRSEWVRDNDDRITRVGRWLRRHRLDELPQFINILRGDMNLVGPRPHPVSNYGLLTLVSRNISECGEQVPCYSLRTLVRPGITGWAQIRYRYANDIDEEMEKLRYDLYYVKHHSVWLDLRILFETVKVVLVSGEDAAASRASPVPPGIERATRTPGRALPDAGLSSTVPRQARSIERSRQAVNVAVNAHDAPSPSPRLSSRGP